MNDQHRMRGNNSFGTSLFEATRRSFLKYLGGAAAAGAIPEVLSGCAPPAAGEAAVSNADSLSVLPTTQPITASYVIARPSDGFDMQMDLINLQVTSGSLVPISTSNPCFVILRTHPQHTGEIAATIETIGGDGPTTGVNYMDAATNGSGPSRLVFALPSTFASVPFNLSSVLGLLATTPLNVSPNALSPSALTNAEYVVMGNYLANQNPDPTYTAVEIPFRLLLSPDETGRIVHSAPTPSPTSGRVELANARLAIAGANGNDESATAARAVRALYSRDTLNPSNLDPAGEGPLQSYERAAIVTQTSVFPLNNQPLPPQVQVDNLILTPHGGIFQANGNWENWIGDLELWKHRTSIGRDDKVQATLMGYVMPFGLRATATQVSKRELNGWEYGAACIMTTWQLHFIDTTRSFSDFPGLPLVGHRAMPFSSITVQQTTFDFDGPPTTAPASPYYFQATANGVPLTVPVVAYDRRGKLVKFDAPLYFILENAGTMSTGLGAYAGSGSNVIPMNGQSVALAPSTKDHTTVETTTLSFGVAMVQVPGSSQMINEFFPYVSSLSGVPTAARHLTGNPVSPVTMHYDPSYAPVPTANNYANTTLSGSGETTSGGLVVAAATQALVNFGSSTVGATFSSSKSAGGLATPNAAFGAIGMVTGLQSSASTIAAPASINWATLLSGAKLFGAINLSDFAAAVAGKQPPAFLSEAYSAAERYAAEIHALAGMATSSPVSAGGALAQLSSQLGSTSPFASAVTTIQAAVGRIEALLSNPAGITAATLGVPMSTNDESATGSTFPAGSIANDISTLVALLAPNGSIASALSSVGYPYSGLARAAQNQLTKAQAAVGAGVSAIASALTMVNEGLDVLRDQKAKIEWVVPLTGAGVPAGVDLLTFGSNGKPSTFCLSVEINGKAPDPTSALQMFCSVDNFTLNFPPGNSPVVQLGFDRIFVSQQPGQKLEVDVNLNGLDFGGALQFVEVVMTLIPMGGFSDPPHIDVTDQGIDAGFSIGLPDIDAGMLAFENLSLSADLNVPFIGAAITFTFGFCSSDSPFLVTVDCLGGGGYFTITLAAQIEPTGMSIQDLEASIDVCAQLAIDIGVASGSLTARAGITFSYDATTGMSLTAFIDLRGAVDVLGLISLCIEAYLGLTYDFTTNCLSGECMLMVDVDICGFSKGVTLDFKQTFWGGSTQSNSTTGPASAQRRFDAEPAPDSSTTPLLSPSFTQVLSETSWAEYCASYAA